MFKIGKVEFKKNKTVIIAEAGVNHNGKIDTAHKLIDAASLSGANAVKFQTFITEETIALRMSAERSVDIDNSFDFRLAEQIITNSN